MKLHRYSYPSKKKHQIQLNICNINKSSQAILHWRYCVSE